MRFWQSTRTKFVYENKLQEYKKEIAQIEEMLQQGAKTDESGCWEVFTRA